MRIVQDLRTCILFVVLFGTCPLVMSSAVRDTDPAFVEALAKHGINLSEAAARNYPTIAQIEAHCNKKMSELLSKRYGPTHQRNAVRQAQMEYPFYALGDTVTATVGIRQVRGKISRIDEQHVRIDGVNISKDDFPAGAFEADLNKRYREVLVAKLYHTPRGAYIAELKEKKEDYRTRGTIDPRG